MNLVGKIFLFLITAMSFVFMGMALTVYATHKNWKDAIENQTPSPGHPLGLKPQLAALKDKHDKLEKQYEEYKQQVADEQQAAKVVLGQLSEVRADLETKRDSLQKQVDALNKKDQESVAALNTASTNLERLTKEVEGLRGEIRQTQNERDNQFKQVVDSTDKIHQLQGELGRVSEREKQVARQVATFRDILRKHRIPETDTSVSDVQGEVLAVTANNLVEVSIGTDDGLKSGDTLEIFRGTHYLGRMRLVRLDSDRAVGEIIPETKKGPIQKGDHVATRLKLG